MSKPTTMDEAVKLAAGKARHAGILAIPGSFGVRRDTGDPGKSGRFSLWQRQGDNSVNILSGIHCMSADEDGDYIVTVPTRDGEKRYVV